VIVELHGGATSPGRPEALVVQIAAATALTRIHGGTRARANRGIRPLGPDEEGIERSSNVNEVWGRDAR